MQRFSRHTLKQMLKKLKYIIKSHIKPFLKINAKILNSILNILRPHALVYTKDSTHHFKVFTFFAFFDSD